MKIDRLVLSDFRGVHNLNLELKGGSTVLFGINGAGKSTVLAAINLLYATIINRIVNQRFKQTMSLELTDIKAGKASAKIAADFIFDNQSGRFSFSRRITHMNKRFMSGESLNKLISYYEKLYVGEAEIDEDNNLLLSKDDFNLPIFANYGVNRLVLKTPLRIRKSQSYGQYSAFEKAIENQIAFGKLFEWSMEQEMDEMQKQKQDPAYQNRALNAVKKAMLAMLDDCEDIHILANPYSMKITKSGDVLDILQLSDGEKCTLALFGDIARRLAIANPSLENPLEGEGVVLIDELELHMHTLWQRKVIGVLSETFPNIQFIITTHSPQVLGEIGTGFNVFSLSRFENEVSITPMEPLYGMDSNSVLEDVLKTDSVSAEVKNKVDLMYHALEQKAFDEALDLADTIDEITNKKNTDTVRARLLIKRGKARNA